MGKSMGQTRKQESASGCSTVCGGASTSSMWGGKGEELGACCCCCCCWGVGKCGASGTGACRSYPCHYGDGGSATQCQGPPIRRWPSALVLPCENPPRVQSGVCPF